MVAQMGQTAEKLASFEVIHMNVDRFFFASLLAASLVATAPAMASDYSFRGVIVSWGIFRGYDDTSYCYLNVKPVSGVAPTPIGTSFNAMGTKDFCDIPKEAKQRVFNSATGKWIIVNPTFNLSIISNGRDSGRGGYVDGVGFVDWEVKTAITNE